MAQPTGAGGGKDRTKPVITITAPASGASVTGVTAITATATDNVAVTKVEFYVNNVLISTDTLSPYASSYNFVTDGSYTIRARAYDKAGNWQEQSIVVSKTTIIIIDPPPDPLPVRVRLTVPTINWAQGSEGSCASFAATMAMSVTKYHLSGATAYDPAVNIFSPEFLYNNVKMDIGCGSGSTQSGNFNFLKNTGCATLAVMPFNYANCTEGIVGVNATAEQLASAAANKLDTTKLGGYGWAQVLATDRNKLKTLLRDGHALSFQTQLDSVLFYAPTTPGWIWNSVGALMGSHMMSIVGYDDNFGYRIKNSYGLVWADNGECWISYEFFETVKGGYVYYCFTA